MGYANITICYLNVIEMTTIRIAMTSPRCKILVFYPVSVEIIWFKNNVSGHRRRWKIILNYGSVATINVMVCTQNLVSHDLMHCMRSPTSSWHEIAVVLIGTVKPREK